MKTSLLVLLLVGVFSTAHAQSVPDQPVPGSPPQERAKFNEYYTVDETVTLPAMDSQQSLEDLFWQQVDAAIETATQVYSLLNFDHHDAPFGNVVEPYNRAKHFGTWIVVKNPQGPCGNTRAEVLRRDSSTPVSMSSTGCTVAHGTWLDPYTNQTFTDARDLQIDHVVPLKNAYVSGADHWTRKQRCLYANYLGNRFHLLPVSGTENTRKGDRSPDAYMPPDRHFQCQYLAAWLKIKMIWGLGLTPPEKNKIQDLAQQNHCTNTELSFAVVDLQAQRRFIADNKDLCQ